jgi:hypothetical protein
MNSPTTFLPNLEFDQGCAARCVVPGWDDLPETARRGAGRSGPGLALLGDVDDRGGDVQDGPPEGDRQADSHQQADRAGISPDIDLVGCGTVGPVGLESRRDGRSRTAPRPQKALRANGSAPSIGYDVSGQGHRDFLLISKTNGLAKTKFR